MAEPLRVLIIEDRQTDLELVVHEMTRAGLQFIYVHVDNEADFTSSLDPRLDVILADFSLPQFDALRALEIMRERGVHVPFIVITGSINEETAVECMKKGATDYLLKDRLARLGPAIEQALEARRLQEEKRRADREILLLSTAIEQWTDSLIITDLKARILYVNPGFERMTGFSRADAMGRSLNEVGPGLESFNDAVRETLARGRVWRGRVECRKSDGGLYTVDTAIAPVRDASGAVVNAVALQRDVTAELELEQRFLHAQKLEALGRLAGGVAHDFNNLLTAIMGYADLLGVEIPLDSLSRSHLEEIKRTAERAAGVSRQLLIFSRKQALTQKVLDLNDTLLDIEKMLKHIIGEDVVLRTSLAPGGVWVRADPGQLQQVVVNLALNSRDAMPAGGTLSMSTRNSVVDRPFADTHPGVQPGAYVELTVRDTGVGMDGEVLSHLFEPFFTTKEEGKGTGLGLATAYGIIRQSGGHIWAESEPGKGASFHVLLPRVEPEAAESRRSEAAGGMPAGRGTIALVEDNELVSNLGAEILRRLGYVVHVFQDAAEASVAVRALGPLDLLIADVVMPVMGGRDLAENLRASFPGLRVLFMSGYESEGTRGLDERTAFLQKPFTPQDLARKVQELLGS